MGVRNHVLAAVAIAATVATAFGCGARSELELWSLDVAAGGSSGGPGGGTVGGGSVGGGGSGQDGCPDGLGDFVLAGSYPASHNVEEITAGDFDHDGDVDLAVVNTSALGSEQGITVHLNLGDASLSPAVFYGWEADYVSIANGDLNGDGHLDLAAAATPSSGQCVNVFFGIGDGTFGDGL